MKEIGVELMSTLFLTQLDLGDIFFACGGEIKSPLRANLRWYCRLIVEVEETVADTKRKYVGGWNFPYQQLHMGKSKGRKYMIYSYLCRCQAMLAPIPDLPPLPLSPGRR
jgi:hypothetical protein